jgi:class 3 adenylate cyclase/pimeloyl-ACP methyl ester carboxylesterase
MEPKVGYATARDGVRIGYAVSGTGPPLISVPSPPDNHVQLEWEDPVRRASVEAFSRYRTVVRFDGRGTGISDRDVGDLSLEARLSDLEAVVDRLGFERIALMSGAHGNQVTVAYAVAHPERVSHIIAVNAFVRGVDFMTPEQLNLWRVVLQADYRLFTDALGSEMFGWGKEEGPRYGEFFRRCVEPLMASSLYEAAMEVDLDDLLPRVQAPVLVIRTTASRTAPVDGSRAFVTALPDAEFALFDEAASEGASVPMIRRIGQFLGEQWDVAPPPPRQAHASGNVGGGLQTVLFTDVEQHTAMMQRLGDARGRVVLREHERITREELRAHGGSEVKAMGDGFLATFRSAQAALDCAMDMQRRFAEPLTESGEVLRVRVGLNAGEPIAEDGDLFGTSVIRAARIASIASGAEILVANVVRELVEGKGYLFADHGHHALRGLDEPVRVWNLRWHEPTP